MMSLYNLTAVQNADTISDLIIAANSLTAGTAAGTTDGILAGGFLITLFLIITYAYHNDGLDISMAVSGFICFTLSLFLALSHVMGFMLVIGFGAITAFSGLYIAVTKKSNG